MTSNVVPTTLPTNVAPLSTVAPAKSNAASITSPTPPIMPATVWPTKSMASPTAFAAPEKKSLTSLQNDIEHTPSVDVPDKERLRLKTTIEVSKKWVSSGHARRGNLRGNRHFPGGRPSGSPATPASQICYERLARQPLATNIPKTPTGSCRPVASSR